MRIVLVLIFTITAGCSSTGGAGFPKGGIKEVSLASNLAPGQYRIGACKEEPSDGFFKIQKNIIFSETFAFCIEERGRYSSYVLTIEKDTNRMCRYEATGHCDKSGMCETIYVPKQCREFDA